MISRFFIERPIFANVIAIVTVLIGAIFGLGWGAATENPIAGLGGGALAGVFIGWFVAAAALEKQKRQKDK